MFLVEVTFESIELFSFEAPYSNVALFEPSGHKRRILRKRNTRRPSATLQQLQRKRLRNTTHPSGTSCNVYAHILGRARCLAAAACGEFASTALKAEGSNRILFLASLTLSTSL